MTFKERIKELYPQYDPSKQREEYISRNKDNKYLKSALKEIDEYKEEYESLVGTINKHLGDNVLILGIDILDTDDCYYICINEDADLEGVSVLCVLKPSDTTPKEFYQNIKKRFNEKTQRTR